MPGSERGERPGTAEQAASLLADVLERASDAFVALDTNWRYIYVNSRAAALFGRQPEDLLGRHIWTEFPEGIGQPFHQAYERAMREQVAIQIEAYYEPWGRWFENRIYPSSYGLSIFFHDITDRKRAEQAARQNAALLADLNDVLERIAAGMPLARTLDALLRVVEAQCPGMLTSILLLESDGVHVRHAAAPSLPAPFVQAIDGLPIGPRAGSCGTAAYRRETVVVDDIATDPLWDGYREPALAANLHACWSMPILDADGRVLGTFASYYREPRGPGDWERRVVEATTHTAAVAISSASVAEARRDSERRLQLAVTGGNVGIWECDVSTGRVVLSDHLKAMFGWPMTAEEVTLEQVAERIHPADRDRFMRALEDSVSRRTKIDVEYRIVCPDGTVRWLATKAVIQCDERDTPVRTMGVTLDVTDRKHAEQEVAAREAQLSDAQRIAHVGSYEWDAATRTLFPSAELVRIYGLSPETFPDTLDDFLARVLPEDREQTRDIIERSTREHTAFDFEHRIVRPDGSIRLLRSQGAWKFEGDSPTALRGVAHDITERRQAERQLRERELLQARNEELKAFAYTVSHDLKAPLRGISGYASELQRRHAAGLDERGRFCVDRILTATHNLNRLIDDLLQYSRVDTEVATRSDINLGKMIDIILRELRPAIVEWRAEVEVDLAAETLTGWERGLRQVLTNLIDNALKYSRAARPPRVRITSVRIADGVRISVSDNGIGFDMRQRERIFGLFNRLVPDEQFEGTGAGLAIVKKLVHRMGGRVAVESRPGAGATFAIELPDVNHGTEAAAVNGPPHAEATAGES